MRCCECRETGHVPRRYASAARPRRRHQAADPAELHDACAGAQIAVHSARTHRRHTVDEFRFAHATQRFRPVGAIHLMAFEKDRRAHIVPAGHVRDQFVEQIAIDVCDRRNKWMVRRRRQRPGRPHPAVNGDADRRSADSGSRSWLRRCGGARSWRYGVSTTRPMIFSGSQVVQRFRRLDRAAASPATGMGSTFPARTIGHHLFGLRQRAHEGTHDRQRPHREHRQRHTHRAAEQAHDDDAAKPLRTQEFANAKVAS